MKYPLKYFKAFDKLIITVFVLNIYYNIFKATLKHIELKKLTIIKTLNLQSKRLKIRMKKSTSIK